MRSHTIWLALLMLAFFDATPARTAEIEFQPVSCTVTIEGQIELGDEVKFYGKFLEAAEKRNCAVLNVTLASAGGNLDAAMKIGRQIRALHATTYAAWPYGSGEKRRCNSLAPYQVKMEHCLCASACFFLWAAGSSRGGEEIYLHRPYFNPTVYRDFPGDTAAAYGDLARSARAYLTDMDIPTPIIDRMFATKSTDGTRLNEKELELLESAPYFEEFIIAKCGKLPAPDTWPTRTSRAKTLHKDAHDDLAGGSFGRVLDTFEPLYGKAWGEKSALDWLMEQTGGTTRPQ